MTSRGILGWLCAGGLAVLAAPAAAQDCATDGDCGPGFACTDFGTIDCGFACPEGQPCPDMPPECEPMQLKGCSPKPCADGSECPDDMVCFEQTVYDCPPAIEADCPPGADCPPPVEPTCTEKSESYCSPKYVPPCTESADCGLGFTCEESVQSTCGGSVGSAGSAGGADGSGAEPALPDGNSGAGGGDAPLPPEPECTETPTGEFYCALVETTCTGASDCPDGFTCEANLDTVVCSLTPSEPVPADGTAGSGAAGSADAGPADGDGSAGAGEGVDACGTATTEPEMVCLPPYWNTGFGRGGGGGAVALEAGGDSSTDQLASGAPAPSFANGPAASRDESAPKGGGFCSVGAVGAGEHAGLATLASLFALGLLSHRRRRAARG